MVGRPLSPDSPPAVLREVTPLQRLRAHARPLAELASAIVGVVALAWCHNEVVTAVAHLQRGSLRLLLWDGLSMSVDSNNIVRYLPKKRINLKQYRLVVRYILSHVHPTLNTKRIIPAM